MDITVFEGELSIGIEERNLLKLDDVIVDPDVDSQLLLYIPLIILHG